LHWLEWGIELGTLNVPYLALQDHLLDAIRGEPRFVELIEMALRESEALECDR
jgi:hypothetical protein